MSYRIHPFHHTIKVVCFQMNSSIRNDVARVAQDLIREGFVVRKPTSYGEHVYLNPKRVYDAKKIAGII
ncbi:hypothetical protein HYZ41_00155 [archaeon]|nr:hypothetical protein [archaeon]